MTDVLIPWHRVGGRDAFNLQAVPVSDWPPAEDMPAVFFICTHGGYLNHYSMTRELYADGIGIARFLQTAASYRDADIARAERITEGVRRDR